MYRHHLFFALSLFCVVLLYQCKSAPLPNNTNFIIPEDFTIVEHDADRDEILALKYKNEMLIVVSLDASKTIKESSLYGSELLRIAVDSKFPNLIKAHNGTNQTELKNYYVGKNLYMHRNFDFSTTKSNGYYEYGAMYIEDPEEYYEIFISGDKTKQEKHQAVIKGFLSGIR